jgi:hypothetical protein
MTIYHSTDSYFCLVPIEIPMLMSFTRFSVLGRNERSSELEIAMAERPAKKKLLPLELAFGRF